MEEQPARATRADASSAAAPDHPAARLYQELDRRYASAERRQLAHVKRFLELVTGDGEVRAEIEAGRGLAVAKAHELDLDPEQIRPLYDLRIATGKFDDFAGWPLVRLYKGRIRELLRSRALMREDGRTAEIAPEFDAWRLRQIRRNDGELGPLNNDSIVYPPVAFELSKGCTVGCWFCGIAADKFQGHFAYTPQNAGLWRDVLSASGRVLGKAVRTGFCYWATDPMDNPDYARFIDDYWRITGAMPQTTTAAPLRNVKLTREVIEMQRRHRSVISRFSITSLKTLRGVHAEFSPEDLLDVELVMQHNEALTMKALAGHALAQYEKLKALGREQTLPHLANAYGTIACVAGFLVNMVESSVQLVSPCRASSRFPKGYKVYARAQFTTGEDLERQMRAMIDAHMPTALAGDDRVAFRDDVAYGALPDGFKLENDRASSVVTGQCASEVGAMVAAGAHTAAEIQAALLERGCDFFAVAYTLRDLFDSGMLAEPVDFAPPVRNHG